ncbi:hypothetical protein PCANC_01872 [Puccinia coronata f. sp. avenae]|uniref:Uncharacterized protein n=1 Tax=Puccinia coronata f. sp. avenae TaxID=200324 RepID=A0A2N5W4C2_9BASI|nr:hypothetical protein PCANC_01872 [Puccinia coronata f. sp. avenae]
MAPYHELLEGKWKTGYQDKLKFASKAPIISDSGGVKIGLGDVTKAETNTSSCCDLGHIAYSAAAQPGGEGTSPPASQTWNNKYTTNCSHSNTSPTVQT